MSRYFSGSYPSLLNKLEAHFTRVRQSFPAQLKPQLEALILGGGYGRGEGGVAGPEETPSLFNDLDYFLFTRKPHHPALNAWVRQMEREESEQLGIDVEVKCLPPQALDFATDTMMFHDLVTGHHVVLGPQDYLEGYRTQLDPARLDPLEAIRLLWNRGSGLFFARESLVSKNDYGFVYRNHQKAALALGDAILCFNGHHDASCLRRKELLEQHNDPLLDEEIRLLHAEGVAFKLRPTIEGQLHDATYTLNHRLRILWTHIYLSLESRRLGQSFSSPAAYAAYGGKLFPAISTPRALMLAIRDRLKRGGCLHPINDYPRGALMRGLTLLNAEEADWEKISAHLPETAHNLSRAREIYEPWWMHYS